MNQVDGLTRDDWARGAPSVDHKYPEVTINLDGTPNSIRADSWRVFINEGTGGIHLPANLDATLRWSELNRLQLLSEVNYTGQDAGIESYVESRPSIRGLAWHQHGKSLIDLQKTSLTNVTVSCGTGPLLLRLPTAGSTKGLTLHVSGNLDGVRVETPRRGEGLALTIWYMNRPGIPNAVLGLELISALHIWHAARIRFGEFACCTALERLDIRGPRTVIEDIAAIARFTKLRNIRMLDCYDFGVEDFPVPGTFPQLESIGFDGLRTDDAKKLGERLKDYPGLSIRGKRTESWIRKNLENPFFTWGGEHGEAIGSRACRIYNLASTAIDKFDTVVAADDVRAVMQKFVEAFNRLGADYALDTIMREEIGDAFNELIRRKPETVTEADASAWFDDLRDF